MKIAACIDRQGAPLSPQEPGILRLFAHEDGVWRHVSDTEFEGVGAGSVAELTRRANRLGILLEGAEALLVRDVRGIAVTLLQNLGLHLWRLDGPPEVALEAVRKALAQTAEEPLDPARFFEPDATEGDYWIDLAAVLANDPGLNSQIVLIPFLEQVPFDRLEVVCDHPPRWLDTLLPAAGLVWEDLTENGICRLLIRSTRERTRPIRLEATECGCRGGGWA